MSAPARPWPPPDLTARIPRTIRLDPGAMLQRFYRTSREPLIYDRSNLGRLNAPDGGYGVLYAAAGLRGAFAETFLREPGRTLLPTDLIETRGLATLRVERSLTLAQFHGPGLAVLGATAEVTSAGEPYDLPQAWSRGLHAHPANLDGVAYRARHDDDEVCFAIFDRAASALVEHERRPDLDDDWFYELLNTYGVGLVMS